MSVSEHTYSATVLIENGSSGKRGKTMTKEIQRFLAWFSAYLRDSLLDLDLGQFLIDVSADLGTEVACRFETARCRFQFADI
jgi:hypothetical protein